jgi:signal transduction histidine kinase
VCELAESVNHHLKTPLAAIVGHSELLLDHRDHLSRQAQHSLAGILRAGLRLDEVVSLVCDLVEVACGCPGDPEPVDISQLVAHEVEAHQDSAAVRGVRLVITGTGDIAFTADPSRLRRAVRAMLQNATTRAPGGSVVRVAAGHAKEEVRITVRADDPVAFAGRGPVQQAVEQGALAEGATTSLGLDLAFASAFASAHGGRFVLTDIPGGGHEARLDLSVGTSGADLVRQTLKRNSTTSPSAIT